MLKRLAILTPRWTTSDGTSASTYYCVEDRGKWLHQKMVMTTESELQWPE